MQEIINILYEMCKDRIDEALLECKAYTDQAILDAKVIPSGTIILWSGTFATIPDGWAQCNGSDGTVDLRNRFIFGKGPGYDLHQTGGTTSHTHGTGAGMTAGKDRTATAEHIPPYYVLFYIQKL